MQDALRQAARDLEVATSNAAAGDFEWAAFVAQQSAEKSVKALLPPEQDPTHTVVMLLERVAPWLAVPEPVWGAARELDEAYRIFVNGLTANHFSEVTSRQLIGDARIILEFCRGQTAASGGSPQ